VQFTKSWSFYYWYRFWSFLFLWISYVKFGLEVFYGPIGENLFPRKVKVFCFQWSVTFLCNSEAWILWHIGGIGRFFHSSVSWKKRARGYIWEILYSMTVLSTKYMRDIAESENCFNLFIVMLVCKLLSCIGYF